MMDREQMLQILGTMSEDNLLKAISATGIDCGDCMPGRSALSKDAAGDEALSSWNATSVVIPQSKRPSLFDKNAHYEKPASAPTRRMDLEPEITGLEELQPNPLTRM
jgi:hypothetical protein